MANCSSILAWRIPWTEEPGGLQSMGSQKVRHDLATKPPAPTNTHTHTHTHTHTRVYIYMYIYGFPGGTTAWGHKESDMTEAT